MFGLNEISWGEFIRLTGISLLGWYLLLFVLYLLRNKEQVQSQYYEDYLTGVSSPERLQPITVYSREYPSEIIPLQMESQQPLETGFYAETGLDEGYNIGIFTGDEKAPFLEILENIHYQQ
jgi:hypothetical protein